MQDFHDDTIRTVRVEVRLLGGFTVLVNGTPTQAGGDWDTAVADLRALVNGPGEPGVMAALARSILARLLARRGDHEAGDVLALALGDPAVAADSFVAGPLAVAHVELGWLDGSLGALTDEDRRALDLAADSGHRSVQAELCAYLRRAGIEVAGPVNAPGPWAPTLAGRWKEAVAACRRAEPARQEGSFVRPKSAAALARSCWSWPGVGHQVDSKLVVSQPARRAPAS